MPFGPEDPGFALKRPHKRGPRIQAEPTHKTCQNFHVSCRQLPTGVERENRITAEAACEKALDKQMFADMIAPETQEQNSKQSPSAKTGKGDQPAAPGSTYFNRALTRSSISSLT